MNYSTAIFLINDKARAVSVNYEPDGLKSPTIAPTTIFKTLDQSIEEDDLVIVETDTRHGYTVCKVVETDVDFDMSSSTQVKWIVGKMDAENHTALIAQENEAIAAIKSAELRKKRADLRESLFTDHAESLKELQIASMGNDEALPAPDEKE